MQVIDDDALDRFAGGWTPQQVRDLVASYRELKAAQEKQRDAFDAMLDDVLDIAETTEDPASDETSRAYDLGRHDGVHYAVGALRSVLQP